MSSSQLSAVQTTTTCRIFHIDGGHTREITQNDLEVATRALLPDGVVFLDDLFNPEWPGVAEGFFEFMRANPGELEPIAIGAGKVVLARPSARDLYTAYWQRLSALHEHFPAGPFGIHKTTSFFSREVLTLFRSLIVDVHPARAAILHRAFARGLSRFLPWSVRKRVHALIHAGLKD